MQIDYVGCNPLDAIGTVPHGVFRLTFVPQQFIIPDSWFAGDWPGKMRQQFDRIGATPYFYPAQGEPTIVRDEAHGYAGVVDVMFRKDQAAAPVQIAAQAVEDSYGFCKLARIELIGPVTKTVAANRPEEQRKTGEGEAKKETANTPGATVKRYAGWALLAVVVGVVGLIVWKAPKLAP